MLEKKFLLSLGIIFLLVFSVSAFAQDTVIVASNENYPDALVASSAAAKIGSPLLLTEKEQLPEETADTISEYSPKEVVIVGGPAVISEEVQVELEENYEVTRLWGVTRYKTANQVAEYFWPSGAKEAVVIQNRMQKKDSEMLAQAKELAREKGAPIFLSPDEEIPAESLAQMQSLGVKEATAIGSNADGMKSSLENARIQTKSIAGNTEQIKERVRQQVMENASEKDWLVVVAAGSYNHSIAAANPAQSWSLIVSGEDEISDTVSSINERNISKVKVAGQPLLAEEIASSLENETNAEVNLVVSQAAQAIRMNRNLTSGQENRERYHNWSQSQAQKWNQSMQQIRQKVNDTMQRAREMVENGTQKANRFFDKAKDKCKDEKWKQCMQDLQKSMSEQRMKEYQQDSQDQGWVQEQIEMEKENLSERVRNLTRMNREFGQMMSQDMNVTERLQVIEQFKERRQKKVKQVMQAAVDMGKPKKTKEWMEKAENKASKGMKMGHDRDEEDEDSSESGDDKVPDNKSNGPDEVP